jgi:hypothetical protein
MLAFVTCAGTLDTKYKRLDQALSVARKKNLKNICISSII